MELKPTEKVFNQNTGNFMSDENSQTGQVSISQGVATTEPTEVCAAEKKGWVKGGLTMAICCTAPILIVAAISLLDLSLGVNASGALSVAAILACPVGMCFMMRMMNKMEQR